MFHWSRDEGDFFRCFLCSEKCFFLNLMNQNKGCVGNPAQKKFENHLEQIWFMKFRSWMNSFQLKWFTSTIWSLLMARHGCFWEDVDGGVIERRDGEPTGVLREKALELIEPLDKEEFFAEKDLPFSFAWKKSCVICVLIVGKICKQHCGSKYFDVFSMNFSDRANGPWNTWNIPKNPARSPLKSRRITCCEV